MAYRSNDAVNASEHGTGEGQGQGLGLGLSQWGQGRGLDFEVELHLDSDSDERPPAAMGISSSFGGIGGTNGMGGRQSSKTRSGSGLGLGLESGVEPEVALEGGGGEESSHNRTRRSERTALLTALAYVCLEMDDDASAYR